MSVGVGIGVINPLNTGSLNRLPPPVQCPIIDPDEPLRRCGAGFADWRLLWKHLQENHTLFQVSRELAWVMASTLKTMGPGPMLGINRSDRPKHEKQEKN